MESDVRQLQRTAARLGYALNTLFAVWREVPSFNSQLRGVVDRVYQLLPDLQEIEVLGMIKRDPTIAGHLGILVEVIFELAELCYEATAESFLLSSSALCIKHSEAVEALDNKLAWAFTSMGYTGQPLLPRRGDIWAEEGPYIQRTCNAVKRHSTSGRVIIMTGASRRTVAARVGLQLQSEEFVDSIVDTPWYNTEVTMSRVLLQAGMLHTSLTPHMSKEVLHGAYARCLSKVKVCIHVGNVPSHLVTPHLHPSLRKLLPSLRSHTIGRVVLIITTQLSNTTASIPKALLVRPPALTPGVACSLATMHILDFLHCPSKMIRQRDKLHALVTRWGCDPFLVSVASAVISVVASNVNAATAAEREEARRVFIDRLLDKLHETEPTPVKVLSTLMGIVPPPPVPGKDIQCLLSSLCEVFGREAIAVPAAAYILDVPFMHMMTALEQLKHIGLGTPCGEGIRLHGSTVDFIEACLPIEDAMKNKLVSRHVVHQSWLVWQCRQECDLGNVAGGVEEYLCALDSTRRSVRSGLRTKDPAVLHLSLSLILQCGWLEAEFLCTPIPSIVRIALRIGSAAAGEHHTPEVSPTPPDSDNEELIDVPLDDTPLSTPKVSVCPSSGKVFEPQLEELSATCKKLLQESGTEQYWGDVAKLLDAADVGASADKAVLFTQAHNIIGYLLCMTHSRSLYKVGLDAALQASSLRSEEFGGSTVNIDAFCSQASMPLADDPFIEQMADRLPARNCGFAAWRSELTRSREISKARNILLQAECLSLLEAYPEAESALAKLDTFECFKVNSALRLYALHVTSSIRLRAVNYRESLDDAAQGLSICRQLQPLCIKMLVRSLLSVVDVNLAQGRYVDADRTLTKCLRLVSGKRKDSHVGILTPNDIEEYLSLLDDSPTRTLVLMCEAISRVARLLNLLQRPQQALAVCSRIRDLVAESLSESHPLHVEVLLCSASSYALLQTDQNLGALKMLEEAETISAACYGDTNETTLDVRLRMAEHLLTMHDVGHAEIVARKVLYVVLEGSEWQGMSEVIRDPKGSAKGWVQWWREEGPSYRSDTHSSKLLYTTMRVLSSVRHAMGDGPVAGELARAAYTMLGNMSMYSVQGVPLHAETPVVLAQEAVVSNTQDAGELLLSAICVCRVLYGHRHVIVSQYLDALGRIHAAQKKYEAALEAHLEALDLARSYMQRVDKCHRVKARQESTGSDESSVSSSSTGGSGGRPPAVPVAGYPHVLLQGMVTSVHPSVSTSLCGLGDTCYALGKGDEGLQHHDASLEVVRQLYSTESVPYTLGLLHVGNIYFSNAVYRKAEEVFRRALAISDRVMSDKHAAKTKILTALATALERQGLFKNARGHYERALQCKQRMAFGSREEVAQAFHNLGINSYNLRDFASAKAHLESCLYFRRDAGFSETHPCVYSVLNWISWVDHVVEHPEDWTLQRHDLPTSVSSLLASTITSITKSFFTLG